MNKLKNTAIAVEPVVSLREIKQNLQNKKNAKLIDTVVAVEPVVSPREIKQHSKSEKNVICSAPWLSLFYSQNSAKVCCANNVEYHGSPSNFLQSDFLKELKKDMLEGNYPSSCSECWDLEREGLQSVRTMMYHDFPLKHSDALDLSKTQVKFLEFRGTNTCNFSCRMCVPEYSSNLLNDIENNYELQKWHQINDAMKAHNTIKEENFNDILNIVSNLDVLNMAGGEPMLIRKNYEILDHMIELGVNEKVKLVITTNCSTVNPYITEKLKKFKNLHLVLSIDATGDIAEYQRQGTIWSQVENNIYKLLDLQNTEVVINSTLTAYSILGIDNLATFLVHLYKLKSEINFCIRIVVNAKHLHPKVLPYELKTRALEKTKNALKVIEQVPDHNAIKFKQLCTFLLENLEEDTDLWNEQAFIKFTKDTDKVYNKSFNKVFNYPLYLPCPL